MSALNKVHGDLSGSVRVELRGGLVVGPVREMQVGAAHETIAADGLQGTVATILFAVLHKLESAFGLHLSIWCAFGCTCRSA